MIPLVIDECLSPKLAALARSRGFDAAHVVRLGRAGASDCAVTGYALWTGAAVVTNNARDFLRLYGRLARHPGLVVLRPAVPTQEQRGLLSAVLDAVQFMPDLIDRLVTAEADGRVRVETWPARDI